MAKYIGTYATYSDIFGYKYNQDKLIELIKEVPLGGVLNVLSQLNSIPGNDKTIRSNFFNHLHEVAPELEFVEKKVAPHFLYSGQGLLAVWKWLLAHGDMKKLDDEILIVNAINTIVYLNLLISDYLYDEKVDVERLKYDMFSNAVFNSESDFRNSLARAALMFDEIAGDSSYFNPKEYLDIKKAFLDHYGYSIKEYLSVVFALFAGFMKSKNEVIPEWNRANDYFSASKIPTIANSILEELSMTISEGSTWSKDTLDETWNYTKFRQKPILKLENGTFFPINIKYLYEQVFDELYFKIRQAYPGSSTQIFSFYGRCFEKYIEILAQEAIDSSPLPYTMIKEFSFGSNKSPDVMIRLGSKLLAVEAKAKRLSMDAFISGSKEAIEKDTHRLVIDPILQLHNCVKELKERGHEALHGIDEIYLMSATLGEFPTLSPFEEDIRLSVEKGFELPIKAYYHVDIEEFEMFVEIISRKNAKPLFKYLDNKKKHSNHLPFKNFLISSSLKPKRLRYIAKKFKKHIDEISGIIFNNPEFDKSID
ncbi:hypothetical protein GC098_14035 [Paenibacillus sp. LMG 31458]|uniref:NERD domain-containing protein n=1 Tax=Paenibacillus phytorum TaxID=2654977 RepID=A0ABX1XXL0_9BACL|nr:hypothetical protein [Paenibacillus phytorum]NOU72533.1 hypothetical protein [Paenibacillus phytorum]